MLAWLDTIKIKRQIKKDWKQNKIWTLIVFSDSEFEQEYKWAKKIGKWMCKKGINAYQLHDITNHELKLRYIRKESPDDKF